MATIHHPTQRNPTGNTPPGQPADHQRDVDERKRREERILDATATLLVRWGYRKTTIDDVAREAGVGKGTIYLHWRDKNELFCAAIWRANQQVSEDLKQRIAADPDGGLPHRLWAHGMLAALANPLVAAMLKGQPDIFQGLLGAFDQRALNQLVGNAETYVAQLQQAGLIRADLPVPVITYLMAALKVGVINAPDLLGQGHTPSMEQLTQALSDLIRRWLEPEQPPKDTTVGKQFLADWLDKTIEIKGQPLP
jgi:AcrR family transcriptional regulator